ncbi:NADH:ubiquinone oxidoreductase, Na(+)-translocating, A subunit [Bacteroidales bacterium KA00344]|nr:NADH:ubiquinone oxidoreductase, Na(+)-translocating, A subunit [Bacteroidales bacterium KA00344]
MANVVKLRKGLEINLKGKAKEKKQPTRGSQEYGLVPDFFVGVTPKVVVRPGDHVLAGDPLFVNKACPEVNFASPVSGTVTEVMRGQRRRVLCVKVKADEKQEYRDFGVRDTGSLDADKVKKALLEAGLFGYVNQLPYAVSTTPDTTPSGIFVSALRDMPLAGDFEFELQGNEDAFQTGITALSKIAPVSLGIGIEQKSTALTAVQNAKLNVFDGPCPAGNVGVQINNVSPVSKGETVWTVDPTAVIFIGRLFLTGKVDLRRTIAVAGSQVVEPAYTEVLVGAALSDILDGRLVNTEHIRIINGNPLTGRVSSQDDYLGAHTSEITVIPEGDDKNELLGWILPRTNEFSVSRSYFTWLQGKKKEYDLDARIKGGKRHMIMSGEYDRVLPMDIYGEYLIKSIIAGDIDKQEQLGIYEISPEDFALAEFVDSSKLPLQKIVREGLDVLRKENE